MRTRHKALVAAAAVAVAVAFAVVFAVVFGSPLPQHGTTIPAPPPTTAPVRPSEPPSTPPPTGAVRPVTAAELGASWRPGCPVAPDQLRSIDVRYLGFDGKPHSGRLVVNEDRVAQVIAIFEQLYAVGYPIDKIQAPEHYPGADDELSMEDNNTSAFNCRGIPGSSRWSEHAKGRAIDINPLLNPYVDRAGSFQPANAAAYLDRTRRDPGVLHDGDPAVDAFTDRGWTWGGHWKNPVDHQHFELP